MSISLDLGSSRLKSLRQRGEHLLGRGCRSAYATLIDSESRRKLLDQLQIPYARCEEKLAIIGDPVSDFTHLFQMPAVPLLPDGHVPQDDPPARQIIASLVEALLPEPQQSGEICCISMAGLPVDADDGEHHDVEFFTRLLRLRGYQPMLLSAGMGVVLAELVDQSFTGIGMSLGASHCEVSLAHRGIEIARSSIPRGGDWIDEQLAAERDSYCWDPNGNRFADVESEREWKVEAERNIGQPADDRETLLAELYASLIDDVLKSAARDFAQTASVRDVPQPLSLVVSGGVARINGFSDLLVPALRKTPFPVEVGTVRMATDSDYIVTRGGLISAELESNNGQTGLRAAA